MHLCSALDIRGLRQSLDLRKSASGIAVQELLARAEALRAALLSARGRALLDVLGDAWHHRGKGWQPTASFSVSTAMKQLGTPRAGPYRTRLGLSARNCPNDARPLYRLRVGKAPGAAR